MILPRAKAAERALILLLSSVTALCATLQCFLFGVLGWFGRGRLLHDPGSLLLSLGPPLCLAASIWCFYGSCRRPPSGSGRSATGTFLVLGSLLTSPLALAAAWFPFSFTLIGYLGMPRRIHPAPTGLAAIESTALWLLTILVPLAAGLVGFYLLVTEHRD